MSSSLFYPDHCHQPHLRSGQLYSFPVGNKFINTSNVAISVSVCFVGSCQSHHLFSVTSRGRLVVKDYSVVIPKEIEDEFMAFWGDNEKYSDDLMIDKGKILV